MRFAHAERGAAPRVCLPSLMYAAIFFDLDDTLFDDTGASRRAVALTCAWLAARYPMLQGLPLESAYLQASSVLWSDDPLKLAGPVRVTRMRAWTAALRAVGADPASAADAVARYAAARRETYVLDTATLPLLHALRPAHFLAIITNGPADLQREKITTLGLAPAVDSVLVAGEVGLAKPDPAIFRLALQHAGCLPARALMIGDSWEKDVMAARAIGMDAVWIQPAAPASADILSHVRDLPAWLHRNEYSKSDEEA